MFTGIIEQLGKVVSLEWESDNLHIGIKADLYPELKIDQSVSHNGICLTVVDLTDSVYTVTAIKETLGKTNLKNLEVGDMVNLERAMKLNARLDGHIVQGHVDQTATCVDIQNENGSWVFTFSYRPTIDHLIIEKGSITVNGISLTALNVSKDQFSVAIIPYTYENTNLRHIQINDTVNLEFDVIGKYVARLLQLEK